MFPEFLNLGWSQEKAVRVAREVKCPPQLHGTVGMRAAADAGSPCWLTLLLPPPPPRSLLQLLLGGSEVSCAIRQSATSWEAERAVREADHLHRFQLLLTGSSVQDRLPLLPCSQPSACCGADSPQQPIPAPWCARPDPMGSPVRPLRDRPGSAPHRNRDWVNGCSIKWINKWLNKISILVALGFKFPKNLKPGELIFSLKDKLMYITTFSQLLKIT